ncbi:MAG: trypsin-like serine protease [Bdellovibrionaceae bacterium]|nr:trypsin-like serine protease [Pseudobdellovibrionaceae bacterium]
MMKCRPLFSSLALAVLLTACGAGGPSGTNSRADVAAGIVGGAEVKAKSPVAAGTFLLYNKNKDSRSICTATLLSRRIALTAAHCVSDEMTAVFALDAARGFQDKARLVKIAVKVQHPEYDALESTNDLALLKLEKDAPADMRPVKFPRQGVAWTELAEIMVAGYGSTMMEKSGKAKTKPPTRLRTADLRPLLGEDLRQAKIRLGRSLRESDAWRNLRTAAEIEMKINPYDSSPLIWLEQMHGRGMCFGDSGGPAFMKEPDGALRQIGVASFVMNDGSEKDGSCDLLGAYTNVFLYKSWISDTFVELGGDIRDLPFPPPSGEGAP